GFSPVLDAASLRGLAVAALLLLASLVLARGRAQLVEIERQLPEVWGALGDAVLATWIGLEADRVAYAVLDPSAPRRLPPPVGVSIGERRESLATALRVSAWLAQACAMLVLGARARRALPRLAGLALAAIALLHMGFWPAACTGWLDATPFVHPGAALELAAL